VNDPSDATRLVGELKDRRFRLLATLDIPEKRYRTRKAAETRLAKIMAALKEANKVCDGEIWTSIEIIYLTRWDCSMARLAAAAQ
jgi:hypothetical protein